MGYTCRTAFPAISDTHQIIVTFLPAHPCDHITAGCQCCVIICVLQVFVFVVVGECDVVVDVTNHILWLDVDFYSFYSTEDEWKHTGLCIESYMYHFVATKVHILIGFSARNEKIQSQWPIRE